MSTDFLERGLLEFEQGNFKSADEYCTSAIKTGHPEDMFEVLKLRSNCRRELGYYQLAMDDANDIMKSHPNSTTGYALCGNALTKLGKFDEALSTFRLGLAIDENDIDIKNGLKDMQADILQSFENDMGAETVYNAVKMSSLEPYPEDNGLEVLERDIMEKWGMTEFPDMELIAQDQKKALKEYKAALQFRKAGNDKNALEKLRSAMRYDVANFTLRGELACLLYDMGEYKEAFRQGNCIPSEFRAAKYWHLGGKIFNALDLPVHAESWLRQGCKVSKGDQDMPLLFQNIRVKRLYGPLTAGTKVNVIFTQYGRAVVASEDISPGGNCFRDQPAVLAQTLDSQPVAACSHCAKNLMQPEDYFGRELLARNGELQKLVNKFWPTRPRIECKKCKSKTIYCSNECRDESWHTYHQVICSEMNPVVEQLNDVCVKYKDLTRDKRCWKGVWNASFSPMILAKIWATIICLANNFAKQKGRTEPTPADWALAKSPFRKFIAFGNSSNAAVIPEMVTLMQRIFDNDSLPLSWRYKITSREFDGRYFQATCNVQAFSDPAPPFNIFINNVINGPYSEVIRMHTVKEPNEAIFAGMFPLHACLNHSCDNNVEVLDGYQGVLVRARRVIKVGEELFTTYIDTRMPRKERRAWLYRGYNFWCQCQRCKFEGDGPQKCTECEREAKADGKENYPGCGKCKRAWYCSTTCQKAAWKKGHKKICEKISKLGDAEQTLPCLYGMKHHQNPVLLHEPSIQQCYPDCILPTIVHSLR